MSTNQIKPGNWVYHEEEKWWYRVTNTEPDHVTLHDEASGDRFQSRYEPLTPVKEDVMDQYRDIVTEYANITLHKALVQGKDRDTQASGLNDLTYGDIEDALYLHILNEED